MEPTDFEKWCAVELGCSPESIMIGRVDMPDNDIPYMSNNISRMYRAYMAGVRSRLPYQTQPPEE